MTTTLNNSKPRKQLSDQLDRLDSILDALSEGLQGAVADATREGVQQAVQAAIVEILTDPTLRARLREATAAEPSAEPPPPPRPAGWWQRLQTAVGHTVTATGQAASRLLQRVVRHGQQTAAQARQGVRTLARLGSLKTLALVGLSAGVGMAVASCLAPHAVAVAVSGLSSAVAAASCTVGLWARRACRALALPAA